MNQGGAVTSQGADCNSGANAGARPGRTHVLYPLSVILLVIAFPGAQTGSAAHEWNDSDYVPPAPIEVTRVIETAQRLADSMPAEAQARPASDRASDIVAWLMEGAPALSAAKRDALVLADDPDLAANMIHVLEMAEVIESWGSPPDPASLRAELMSLPTVPLDARDEADRRRVEMALSLAFAPDEAWAAVTRQLGKIKALRSQLVGEGP